MAKGQSKWDRHREARGRAVEAQGAERVERAQWQVRGRPEVLWTGKAAGQDLTVIESDADGAGKRRKRRVKFLGWQLTANQAQEVSDAFAQAAEHARRGKG
jgi:hypothetical protein